MDDKKNEICECGNPLPCDLHTVNYDMAVAYATLQRLTPSQRGRVLTWFCPWCHRYLPPGEPVRDCLQAKCLRKKEGPDVGRR